jgi:5-formyltetrahydrofolate cyclo-ligase
VIAEGSVASEKRRLRTDLRAVRRALDADALARAARAVATVAEASAALVGARSVLGYVACDGEIDVAPVLAAARARGACIALPRCRVVGGLDVVVVGANAELVRGARGRVAEPSGPAADPATLSTPGLALVPSVALDRRGFRLGRGGGDYDRLLPSLRACGWTIVGVCHAASVVERLPVEAHDVPVDVILSDAGLLPSAR